ncbi:MULTISPECIES: FRG domain-containing protein [Nocardiaceae]|uniref:FRG domain-containing protein n=1 Tax=Nocardiaceae TaxID=85025 RepID=UPI001595EE46|nr:MULTISPECIES: FRG domain-containing protein [Rhodococcus]
MISVDSVHAYVEVASQRDDGEGVRWFRGIRSIDYALTPSLYRPESTNNKSLSIDETLKVEQWLLDRFAERSAPFRSHNQSTEKIELLFEMQHYGTPTRLLDWSESALVSLWFAVMGDSADDSAVWILNPAKWNDLVFSQRKDVKNVLAPLSPEVIGMQPWASLRPEILHEAPLCIYGVHNSTRIVSQRGVFTLGGRSMLAMEEQVNDLAKFGTYSETELLSKIVIPQGARDDIRSQLTALGFTHSMIFPDLAGLAKELTERLDESGLV